VTFLGWDVTDMGQNVTDMGFNKTENKRELKKHAATIHCSNTLSLLQRKVSNALLYHAYNELMLKDEHEITVKQLCRLIGYQGNNHAVIKEALKGLISTVIEWNVIDDETGTENWTASSIIASVSLEGPICYYAYSPRMKQLLHSPSMFGKIDLVIQSKFRSSYGLALYENCIRYRGLPYSKWFDIDLFKKLMGIPAGMYEVFRDFKKRVLDKAIDEVNTYSDLIVSSEFLKESRKVKRIRFKLEERAKKIKLGDPKKVKNLTHATDLETTRNQLLSDFNLTIEQIEKLLLEHDLTFIREKIDMVAASKPFQTGKIQNRAGYLLSAIKNNYQAAKVKTHEVIHLQDIKFELEVTEAKREIECSRVNYQQYREEAIEAAINDLHPDDKRQFMQMFLHYAEPAIHTVLQLQRNKYTRETVLDSPQIKALMRHLALRELDNLSLMPLEEFILTQNEKTREAWQKLKSYDPDHPLLRFSE